ncbi:MAG: hypothetical protein LQ340_007556 [Diploschistes diacapsis]|nr:MAG: hypothetical protein LQ340_007556 [Diploschistes diacapsis]
MVQHGSSMLGTISPNAPEFQQAMNELRIAYPEDDAGEPRNFGELQFMLKQEHPGLAKVDFDSLTKSLQESVKLRGEADVLANIGPLLFRVPIEGLVATQEQLFSKDSKFSALLTQPKPDYYEGEESKILKRNQFTEEQRLLLMPATDKTAPWLPNFFFEAKGKSGKDMTLQNQAVNNLVYGGRAMDAIRKHCLREEEAFDEKAHTICATYYHFSKTLTIYCIHRTRRLERYDYVVTELAFYSLKKPDSCWEALKAVANVRSWASLERKGMLTRLKESKSSVSVLGKRGRSVTAAQGLQTKRCRKTV